MTLLAYMYAYVHYSGVDEFMVTVPSFKLTLGAARRLIVVDFTPCFTEQQEHCQ